MGKKEVYQGVFPELHTTRAEMDSPGVQRFLQLFDTSPMTWDELRSIYEEVNKAMGKKVPMRAWGRVMGMHESNSTRLFFLAKKDDDERVRIIMDRKNHYARYKKGIPPRYANIARLIHFVAVFSPRRRIEHLMAKTRDQKFQLQERDERIKMMKKKMKDDCGGMVEENERLLKENAELRVQLDGVFMMAKAAKEEAEALVEELREAKAQMEEALEKVQ